MLQSRRGFLIGAGEPADDSVRQGCPLLHSPNGQPLLAPPTQVVQTLYWYEIADEGYQLTLGPWSFAPPPPRWSEFFVSEGIPHRTDEEIEKICSVHCIEPGISTILSKDAIGRNGLRSQVVRSPGRITCCKKLTSALSATRARTASRIQRGAHPGDSTY